METAQKKIFHNIVADILGLEKSNVINSYLNKPRPQKTYCTLRYYGYELEVPNEIRKTKSPGVLQVVSPGLLTCEIQYFAGKEVDACNELAKLINAFDKPSIVAQLDTAKIVIVDSTAVQDISALLENTNFETRASVDITIRFTKYLNDDVGYITKVDIDGSTNERALPIYVDSEEE